MNVVKVVRSINTVKIIRQLGQPSQVLRQVSQPIKLILDRGPVVLVSGGGGDRASFTAAVPIIDRSAVALTRAGLVPYDATRGDHAYAFCGLALNSADPGQSVLVQRAGEIDFVPAGLVAGQTFIAGAGGRWQPGRATGLVFVHKILRAVSANRLQLLQQPLIFL